MAYKIVNLLNCLVLLLVVDFARAPCLATNLTRFSAPACPMPPPNTTTKNTFLKIGHMTLTKTQAKIYGLASSKKLLKFTAKKKDTSAKKIRAATAGMEKRGTRGIETQLWSSSDKLNKLAKPLREYASGGGGRAKEYAKVRI